MLPHQKLKKSQLIAKLQLAGKKIQLVAISLMKAVTSMLKDFQHILVRTVKV